MKSIKFLALFLGILLVTILAHNASENFVTKKIGKKTESKKHFFAKPILKENLKYVFYTKKTVQQNYDDLLYFHPSVLDYSAKKGSLPYLLLHYGFSNSTETSFSYADSLRKNLIRELKLDPRNNVLRAFTATAHLRLLDLYSEKDAGFFHNMEWYFSQKDNHPSIEMTIAKIDYYRFYQNPVKAIQLIESYPKWKTIPELAFQRAAIEASRSNWGAAVAFSSLALNRLNYTNPRYALLQANALFKMSRVSEAEMALANLALENPSFGPAHLELAKILQSQGKHKSAFEALSKLFSIENLQLDPIQRSDAFLLAGNVLVDLGNCKQALEILLAPEVRRESDSYEALRIRILAQSENYGSAYSLIELGMKQQNGAKSAQTKKEAQAYLENAEVYYLKALNQERRDPKPFLLLGDLYQLQNRLPDASAMYKRAWQTQFHPAQAALNLAKMETERYEFESAQGWLEAAKSSLEAQAGQLTGPLFAEDSHSYDFETAKIIFLEKTGNPEIAATLQSSSLFPNDAVSYNSNNPRTAQRINQSARLNLDKNPKLAQYYYALALRNDPENEDSISGLAKSLVNQGRFDEAVSILEWKIEANLKFAQLKSDLGMVYLSLGNQESGKQYIQSAIRTDSKLAKAFLDLGDLTQREGSQEKNDYASKRNSYRYALASFEMYSKLKPSDPEGFKRTGDLYFEILDLGSAAKNYHQALNLAPKIPGLRLRLAQIARNGGDREKALKLIDDELRLYSKNEAALIEQGNIFMADRKLPLAANSYSQALGLNPENEDASFGLSVVLHLQGAYAQALASLAHTIQINPKKKDAYWQIALIYRKQNEFSLAQEFFEKYKTIADDQDSKAKAQEKIEQLAIITGKKPRVFTLPIKSTNSQAKLNRILFPFNAARLDLDFSNASHAKAMLSKLAALPLEKPKHFQNSMSSEEQIIKVKYANTIEAYANKEFSKVQDLTDQILRIHGEYHETNLLNHIAKRGLAAIEESKEEKRRFEKWTKLKKTVSELEEIAALTYSRLKKDNAAKIELENIIVKIYEIDPNNKIAAKYQQLVIESN